MKTSALFLVLSSAAINGAFAGCFGGTKFGGERGYAEQAVDNYCDPDNHDSFTATSFKEGQTKAYCYQLSGAKKADYTITWKGKGTLGIKQEHCASRLKAEILGCNSGGSSNIADWEVTVDPNDGTCDPPDSKREVKFTA